MKYQIYGYKNRMKNYRDCIFKTMIDDSFVVFKFVICDDNYIFEFTVDKEIDWDTLCIITPTDIQFYSSQKDIVFKKQKLDIETFTGHHKMTLTKEQKQWCEDIINFAFKKMYVNFGL